MEPELTPEQKEQMSVWAGQRDALNIEILHLRQTKEALLRANNDLANSSSNIRQQIISLNTRLEELDKKESDYNVIISSELSDALVKHVRLQGEVTNLEKIIKILQPQKDSLVKDIAMLTETFNTVNNRVGVLDKVVAHVTTVSEKNIFAVDELVASVKKSMQELVDINKKNVADTEMVAKELPRVFFDIKKQSLDKRKI